MRYLFLFLCLVVLAGFIEPRAQAAPFGDEVGCHIDGSFSGVATLTAPLVAELPTSIKFITPDFMNQLAAPNDAPEMLRRVWDGAASTTTVATLHDLSPNRGWRLLAPHRLLC